MHIPALSINFAYRFLNIFIMKTCLTALLLVIGACFPFSAFSAPEGILEIPLVNVKVTICEELYDHPQFIIGDLTKQSLGEVWHSKKAHDLYNCREIKNSSTVCGLCNDIETCRTGAGVCWKMVLMAYGNDSWNFPDPRCPKAPFPAREMYYE